MSQQEILELKAHANSAEVADAIAQSSSSFGEKTAFAQAKYLRKKMKKHLVQVTLLRPTLGDLCEAYFETSNGACCGLRFDYLGCFLHQLALTPRSRVLVFDEAMGLVTAGILQRAALAEVFAVTATGGLRVKAVHESGGDARRLTPVQFADLWELPDDRFGGVDAAAVITARTLPDLSRFVRPGGTVVTFSPFLQEAVALFTAWKAGGRTVHVKMQEFFLREHQVLPHQTHPVMGSDVNLFSGFLVSAYRVVDEGGPPSKKQRTDP